MKSPKKIFRLVSFYCDHHNEDSNLQRRSEEREKHTGKKQSRGESLLDSNETSLFRSGLALSRTFSQRESCRSRVGLKLSPTTTQLGWRNKIRLSKQDVLLAPRFVSQDLTARRRVECQGGATDDSTTGEAVGDHCTTSRVKTAKGEEGTGA